MHRLRIGATFVHWLGALGFTLAICQNMAAEACHSMDLDRQILLIVQPNLRYWDHNLTDRGTKVGRDSYLDKTLCLFIGDRC